MTIYYTINEDMARQAQGMWSFTDYINGLSTDGYKAQVDEVYKLGEKAIEKGADSDKVAYLCDRFSKQYADYINKGFAIEMRCPSIIISGGSNFPASKKEKQNVARNKHYLDYDKIMSVKSKLKNLYCGSGIIKSGDVDTIEQLQNKLIELEIRQDEMAARNAYYYKNDTMKGYSNLRGKEASEIDEEVSRAYSFAKQPYPLSTLGNNNNKIKNTRNRLKQLQQEKSKQKQETNNEYFKVIENTEIMRLQLIFNDKPNENIRSILKSRGYKWSPTNSAWQRQLTQNARDSIEYIIEKIKIENQEGENK